MVWYVGVEVWVIDVVWVDFVYIEDLGVVYW